MASSTESITDEYEYTLKKFRRAMIEHRGTGNVVAEELNNLLTIIFRNCPNWSMRRAITKIYNDKEDLGYSRDYLYNFLNEEHRKKVSKIGHDSSSKFFTETPKETYERLQKEKTEVEKEAEATRKKHGTSKDDKPEEIDKRYLTLQNKLKKALEQVEDQKEHVNCLSAETN